VVEALTLGPVECETVRVAEFVLSSRRKKVSGAATRATLYRDGCFSEGFMRTIARRGCIDATATKGVRVECQR